MNLKNALQVPSSSFRWGSLLALSAVIVCGPVTTQAQERPVEAQINNASIFVDPDVRVSYDGDVVHMEAYATASATNADLLVAGGELIVPGRRLYASEARIY